MASAPSTRRQASYVSGAAEDQKRQRISDCMREVSSRLMQQLDLAGRVDFAADDDLWARAESAASQMVNDLSADGSLPAGVEPDALSKDVVQETLGTGRSPSSSPTRACARSRWRGTIASSSSVKAR